MSNRSTTLAECLAAIVADEREAVRLVRAAPGIALARVAVVALHRAVRARSPEAVRCLLERGARVDATHGRQRTTPLHIATQATGASARRERAPSSSRSWRSLSATARSVALLMRTGTCRERDCRALLILMGAMK